METSAKKGNGAPHRGTALREKGQRVAKKVAPLGNKGRETRQLLMATARGLLDKVSPLSLSAATISKEAGTSPATFYVYFDNDQKSAAPRDAERLLALLSPKRSAARKRLVEELRVGA